MYSKRAYARRQKEFFYAFSFTGFLLVTLFLSTIFSFNNMGPVVLGTEMNTNGMVEYLCLGRGCENMTDFNWTD